MSGLDNSIARTTCIDANTPGSYQASDSRCVVFRRVISASIDPGHIQNVVAAPTVTGKQTVLDADETR